MNIELEHVDDQPSCAAARSTNASFACTGEPARQSEETMPVEVNSELSARIDRLYRELGEAEEQASIIVVHQALEQLHAMGLEAAVLGVREGKPYAVFEGALHVHVRRYPPEQRWEISRILDTVAVPYKCSLEFMSPHISDADNEAAFADEHFAWSSEGAVVVRPEAGAVDAD